MISPKKLIKLARRWQRQAAEKTKRIALPRDDGLVTGKGHFVVYTADERRFVLPISFLNNHILKELLIISEEEFGLPSTGPIKLPCDAMFMEYVVSLMQKRVDRDTEKALLMSIATSRCSSSCSLTQEQCSQQLLLCSF